MKIKRAYACFCALPFLAGCASPTLSPLPSSGQTVEYHSGQPTIISKQTNVVVAGLVTNEVDDHAIVYIGALNRSAGAATLGTENVSASSGDRRLTVFSYEALARHVRVSAVWQKIGLAMSAGARMGATVQPTRTYVQGNIYGNYGQSATYTATAQTYDSAATAVAQSVVSAETRAQASELNAQTDARMGQLSGILRTTTIHLGQFAGGIVEINDTGMKNVVGLRQKDAPCLGTRSVSIC